RFFSGILGPGPRSYVPSMGTQALTRLRLSNMNERSTWRSFTTGNVDIGSSLIGWSSLSTSAVQYCLALPLMTIEQAPQTSSRQFISHVTGVVFCPLELTGFLWISIRPLITFM